MAQISNAMIGDAGGVHVIQTFFSTDIAEEVQIKGRCARQGEEGSYRYVPSIGRLKLHLLVPTIDLTSDFLFMFFCICLGSMVLRSDDLTGVNVSSEEAKKMHGRRELYSYLQKMRQEAHSENLKQRIESARRNELDHDRSLACQKAMIARKNRSEIISFLHHEINGGDSSSAFTTKFLLARAERLSQYEAKQKEEQEMPF